MVSQRHNIWLWISIDEIPLSIFLQKQLASEYKGKISSPANYLIEWKMSFLMIQLKLKSFAVLHMGQVTKVQLFYLVLLAKPGNKRAAPSWPDPYVIWVSWHLKSLQLYSLFNNLLWLMIRKTSKLWWLVASPHKGPVMWTAFQCLGIMIRTLQNFEHMPLLRNSK